MVPANLIGLAMSVIVLAIMVAILFNFLRYFRLWLKAILAGAPVSVLQLVGMNLRKADMKKIVDNLIVARQSGLAITPIEMERAYLRGVDIDKVTLAAIEANRRNMDLSFEQLIDAELEGRLADKLGIKGR